MIRVIITILIIGFCKIDAKALNYKQINILKQVKEIAKNYPNKHGKTLEKIAMAICLSETGAGKSRFGDKHLLQKGIKEASYGVMQVRLQTAKFVAKVYKLKDIVFLSDISLIKKMMNDDKFNIKLAILYLVWLSNNSKDHFETISRYNGGKVNHSYYNKVKKNLQLVKKYNL